MLNIRVLILLYEFFFSSFDQYNIILPNEFRIQIIVSRILSNFTLCLVWMKKFFRDFCYHEENF